MNRARKQKLKNNELIKAKEYALRSLTCQEQTEYQIRVKLQQKEYDAAVIEAVIAFLKEYKYIDDRRFIEQYIASHCKRMNLRQLQERLYRKGIKTNTSMEEYLELYGYDESELLERALNKYVQNKDLSDLKVRQKVVAYFVNKGYAYSNVYSALMLKVKQNTKEEDV